MGWSKARRGWCRPICQGWEEDLAEAREERLEYQIIRFRSRIFGMPERALYASAGKGCE